MTLGRRMAMLFKAKASTVVDRSGPRTPAKRWTPPVRSSSSCFSRSAAGWPKWRPAASAWRCPATGCSLPTGRCVADRTAVGAGRRVDQAPRRHGPDPYPGPAPRRAVHGLLLRPRPGAEMEPVLHVLYLSQPDPTVGPAGPALRPARPRGIRTMGFLDALLGRSKAALPNLDQLFLGSRGRGHPPGGDRPSAHRYRVGVFQGG